MPILQYETQIAKDGSITLPLMPEYHSRKVVVSVAEHDPFDDDDWEPDPADVRKFMDFIENRPPIAADISDEEIEQLKHERRMKKLL